MSEDESSKIERLSAWFMLIILGMLVIMAGSFAVFLLACAYRIILSLPRTYSHSFMPILSRKQICYGLTLADSLGQ